MQTNNQIYSLSSIIRHLKMNEEEFQLNISEEESQLNISEEESQLKMNEEESQLKMNEKEFKKNQEKLIKISDKKLKKHIHKAWQCTLEPGIKIIYNNERLSKPYFMKMYSEIYDCCNQINLNHNIRQIYYQYIGFLYDCELYFKISDFLSAYLVKFLKIADNLPNSELCMFYTRTWFDYQTKSKLLNGVFIYFNHFWVRPQKPLGRRHNYSVYELAMVAWYENMVIPLLNRLSVALLELNENEPNKMMNTNIIILTINNIYEIFKLKKCDYQNAKYPALEMEQNPASIYKKSLKDIFSKDTIQFLEKLKCVSNWFDEISTFLENHITTQGKSVVENYKEYAINDPELFFNKIQEVINRYNELIIVAFDSDSIFLEALNKGCSNLMNSNISASSLKVTHILARYIGLLIEKSRKSDENINLDDKLNQTLLFYKHINDKYEFKIHFYYVMSLRLAQNDYIDEGTKTFISKILKEFELDNDKIKKMFNDLDNSKKVNDEFKLSSSYKGDIDLNVKLLNDVVWKFKLTNDLILPVELERNIQAFAMFYNKKPNKKMRLTWLHELSRGELVSNCFNNHYEIEMSTFLMAILLQFNCSTFMTIQQIRDLTGIDKNLFYQCLRALLKTKLLLGDDTKDELCDDSTIYLNTDFKSKKLRVIIDHPIEEILNKAKEQSEHDIEQGRKQLIESTIVNIMKKLIFIEHKKLYTEVMRHKWMLSQFTPSVDLISQCIESLREKKYLQKTAMRFIYLK